MEEIVRLTPADYEQAIDFLDLVFSQNARPHHFEKMLPRLAMPDAMAHHFALKRDGRIRAMLGVYPLETLIDGERFLFSTTGNVATHWHERGKGYMSRLLDRAMTELHDIGADASRLGGHRQRYNRYGFEMAGTNVSMSLTAHNIQGVDCAPLEFRPVTRNDAETLALIRSLHARSAVAVDRGDNDSLYRVLTAWEAQPFAAFDENNRFAGYLVSAQGGGSLAELKAETPDLAERMLLSWINAHPGNGLSFTLPPWETETIARLSRHCQSLSLSPASQFKIISWTRLINALGRIKARMRALPDGECIIDIPNEVRFMLRVKGGIVSCEETTRPADLTLDHLTATRLLFGPLPPEAVLPGLNGKCSAMLSALLPLPLSWNGQDRV